MASHRFAAMIDEDNETWPDVVDVVHDMAYEAVPKWTDALQNESQLEFRVNFLVCNQPLTFVFMGTVYTGERQFLINPPNCGIIFGPNFDDACTLKLSACLETAVNNHFHSLHIVGFEHFWTIWNMNKRI